ncbi:hypothetical protein [Veillonella sp.]|jgi:hypothetical protein|uniref:hypothetical protein n=1 Tax=Veillonella TaxID=29465 RepID=UPI00290C6EC9|nr:hypothetical protein [Veillonella sp.]MDU4443450.1 hypothetical protein [Veillonella sp.]
MGRYESYFKQYDLDIRKSNNGRWLDQKCTYDVISIIADSILEYTNSSLDIEFTVNDIWQSDYARNNVISIFSKPDPSNKAKNEYDKYFGQPIKLLEYSRILSSRKVKNTNLFRIINLDILESIALRPSNALEFLVDYITKVLKDSQEWLFFECFLNEPSKDLFYILKNEFIQFTIQNTKINTDVECGRIFTKVLNPLSFAYKTKGTIKGRISKNNILLTDLQYNRLNWRDELSGKSKEITRNEYDVDSFTRTWALSKYNVDKAKKAIRLYNKRYYNGQSEVYQKSEMLVDATQAHHIFPQSEYPMISDYVENLIMLTPNQHYAMAHPANNTSYIDPDFQYYCLLSKTMKIKEDIEKNIGFYSFDSYRYVLNQGLETTRFNSIKENDFSSIINFINDEYGLKNMFGQNKYNGSIEIVVE